MKMHAPRRVADLVASALPQLSDRLVEIRIRAHWGALVGPDMARRTQPGRLEHGCLTVTVDNSPWLQELTLRQAELTSRLADQVPEVQRLRLVLGTLTREMSASAPRRPRLAPLTASDVREIDDAVSVIGDTAVASAARRLLASARQLTRSRGTG